MWPNSDRLLGLIADLLIVGNWQRSGDKQKPKLIFATEQAEPGLSGAKVVLPDEQIRDVLTKMREGEL